jgi:hypothetical protein
MSLAFSDLGKLDCPVDSDPDVEVGAVSMSVDRNGNAWVLMEDGFIYRVDLVTMACSATGYTHDFGVYGMGFSYDGAEDTLFVAGPEGTLGTLDVHTGKGTIVGLTDGFSGQTELTGSGDGRLFGVRFDSEPYSTNLQGAYLEYDKSTGLLKWYAPQPGVVSIPIDPAGGETSGFAVAFWGGDLWTFIGTGQSSVYRYPLDTKTPTEVLHDIGYLVTGAGVSTCAPIVAPK